VPGLGSLLKPQDWHRTETVFGRDMLKEYEETSSPKKVPADPFQKLPAEVASMVVHDLPSRDIANLRLAVRAFRELPNILFRRLLLEDMPWFWEVRDLPPAKTDWYQLYREAKSCWGNLKGLMNRKRIWRDVEQIVRRIERYRAEGKVGDAAILRCEG